MKIVPFYFIGMDLLVSQAIPKCCSHMKWEYQNCIDYMRRNWTGCSEQRFENAVEIGGGAFIVRLDGLLLVCLWI